MFFPDAPDKSYKRPKKPANPPSLPGRFELVTLASFLWKNALGWRLHRPTLLVIITANPSTATAAARVISGCSDFGLDRPTGRQFHRPYQYAGDYPLMRAF